MSAPRIAPGLGILKTVAWAVMALLAVLMFLLASRYLTFNPEVYFDEQKEVYLTHTPGIMLHIIGAMVATILGPFQFLPTIRSRRFLNIHRWLGRSYLIGVLVGGLAGLYMATMAYGGWPARLGFSILAILWLYTGAMAYKHIRNKETELHRQWMTRNYALTFAAVTLRLWQGVFLANGVEFIVSYATVAWLSWIPNLLIAEWMVSRLRRRRTRAVTA